MRKISFVLAAVLCLVAAIVIGAEYYTGSDYAATATTDYAVAFDGSDATGASATKVTFHAPDADVNISFWNYNGSTWDKIAPTVGDTFLTVPADKILTQLFPIRGKYPNHIYIDRTSTTPVTVLWR